MYDQHSGKSFTRDKHTSDRQTGKIHTSKPPKGKSLTNQLEPHTGESHTREQQVGKSQILEPHRWSTQRWVTYTWDRQELWVSKHSSRTKAADRKGYNMDFPEEVTPSLPLWSWAGPSESAVARRTEHKADRKIFIILLRIWIILSSCPHKLCTSLSRGNTLNSWLSREHVKLTVMLRLWSLYKVMLYLWSFYEVMLYFFFRTILHLGSFDPMMGSRLSQERFCDHVYLVEQISSLKTSQSLTWSPVPASWMQTGRFFFHTLGTMNWNLEEHKYCV